MFRKKSPSDDFILPFFLQKCRIWPFFSFIYMIRIRFVGPRGLNQNGLGTAKSEWVLGRTVMMSTCNHLVRRCTSLMFLSGCSPDRIFRTSFCDFPSLLSTDSNSGRLPKSAGFVCHHLLLTAIGLPMQGQWDYGTRRVQMTTMHSVVLVLASNNDSPNLVNS